MEGSKIIIEDAPLESSPAPAAAHHANEDAATNDSRQNLIQSSPDENGETGPLETEAKSCLDAQDTTLTAEEKNQEASASPEDNNNATLAVVEENQEPSPGPEDNNATHGDSVSPSALKSEDSDAVKPLEEENVSPKIIARLTREDEPSDSSPQVKNGPTVQLANVATKSDKIEKSSPKTPRTPTSIDFSRGQIDTTAPFESVKAAVSKFGGIVDWKAHRMQAVERRKTIEVELEKAQVEIPLYKKQSEAAEAAKKSVLKELDS